VAGEDLGGLAGPQLVRAGRVEVPLHEIRGADIARPGSAPPPPGVPPDQPGFPHQAGHPLAAAAHAQPDELAVYPGRPVRSPGTGVDLADGFGQRLVRLAPLGNGTVLPRVEP